jgi:hypothetical protein
MGGGVGDDTSVAGCPMTVSPAARPGGATWGRRGDQAGSVTLAGEEAPDDDQGAIGVVMDRDPNSSL